VFVYGAGKTMLKMQESRQIRWFRSSTSRTTGLFDTSECGGGQHFIAAGRSHCMNSRRW
jgi:hypothetical protein